MSEHAPEKVLVKGNELKCLVCGYDRFWSREALLNTAVASFFNVDWANPKGICQICDSCGYIHWFYPKNN